MTTTTYLYRGLGGRRLGVTYNDVAGTILVLGQSLALSSVSTALQAQFAAALASGTGASTVKAAFGGDNVSQAVGAIMDAAPAWRAAIMAAAAGLQQSADDFCEGL